MRQYWLRSGLLLVVLVCSALLRFHNIDERGIDGSDNVFYTNIAKEWTEGDINYRYQLNETGFVYRPVVFFFYAVAIKLFGYHDSSIKKMNAGVDVVNALFIFLLCSLLIPHSVIPAFSASLCYGLLPLAIRMSRIELTHILSGLFVLLACTAFVSYFLSTKGWHRSLLLMMTGVLVVLGSLTHEELILLGPGYLLFLLLAFIRRGNPRKHLRSLVIDGALLSATMAIGVYHTLWQNINIPLTTFIKLAPGAPPLEQVIVRYIENVPRMASYAIMGVSSSLVLGLTVLLLLLLCSRPLIRKFLPDKQKNRPLPVACYLPLTLILTYLVCFVYLRIDFMVRLFLPLFPLLLIFLVVCYYTLLRRISLRLARVVVLTGALLVMLFNLEHFQAWKTYLNTPMRWYHTAWAPARLPIPFKLGLGYKQLKGTYYPSWSRRRYKELREQVNSESKVLITSSLMYPWRWRRILQLGYYFGDNAIYLIDHNEPLDQLVATYNIKYVLFSYHSADERILEEETLARYEYEGRWKADEDLHLGASYGFAPGEYTLEKEKETLFAFLENQGARLLFQEEEQTWIYELAEATDSLNRRQRYCRYLPQRESRYRQR